jgi:uncharacterized protein YcbK (DUF882 family)
MDDIQLVPHFKLSELVKTSVVKYQKKNLEEAKKIMGRMYQLAGFAERVREILGKPMIITSGFRCPGLNKAVGGAISSQHRYAEAIDFKCKGMTDEQVACKLAASDLKFQQLIIENNGKSEWVHISIGSKREVLRYKDGRYTKLGQLS